MKKLFTFVLITILTLSIVIVTAGASKIEDFAEDGEFVIASYNGVKSFTKTGGNVSRLEDSVYWLLNNRESLNLKYVSFFGHIANLSEYQYANVVQQQGMTVADLELLTIQDPVMREQYKGFSNSIKGLRDDKMPFGLSIKWDDYVGASFSRGSLVAEYFNPEDISIKGVTQKFKDEHNYYTVVENNGVKYMIFQLELWPMQTTLDWFNSVMQKNPDKYAIIYTPTFIDGDGSMYTMWDWKTGFDSSNSTTSISTKNITWTDKPRDGDGLWSYSFSKYNNILAVISTFGIKGSKIENIAVSKITNDQEVEVAAIAADTEITANTNYGPTALLVKFSKDNSELTCAFASSSNEVIDSTIKKIKLNKVGTLAEPTTNDSLPKVKTQYNGANNAYIFGYDGNVFRPNANMTRAEACTIFARLILGVQTIPEGYSTRFEDVKKGDWFYNAIAYLDETGFFFRNKNTSYKPNEPITRAEFVELAVFASSLRDGDEVAFKDVPTNHFYYNAIMTAASSGLVNGYEDETFRPDNTITRAEVVTVINRLLGLKATARNISEENIENEFVDIGTHWGRLNILMASNSSVHGDYYYASSLDGVEESTTKYTFTNSLFSFTVDKNNGKVTSFINMENGTDVLSNKSNPYFIFLDNYDREKVYPEALETEGNRIKVTFKDESVVYLLIHIEEGYMSFEIDSEVAPHIAKITFSNIITNLPKADNGDDYVLNSVGMSAWTNPGNVGYRESAASVSATAETIYDAGTMGAKLGIVFSKKSDTIKHLQSLVDDIDKAVGLTSKAGGPYAMEFEGNFGDYGLLTALKPETVDTIINISREIDIDQLDIHQGSSTFRQGDFHFAHTENGTAKEYYEKIGQKFDKAGLDTGLHTYAYYVDYNAAGITANPKWQKQLEITDEIYSIRSRLTKTSKNVKTAEDVSGFNTTKSFFTKNSPYILIDEEIILVGQGTSSGFINCVRGQCGTQPAKHEVGAKIYHLTGYFNMFVPVLGSELFYHIADLTAKAYNDGGFDMIYLDAIDGLSKHTKGLEQTWYYYQMFTHRILSQCNSDPIVEFSNSAPQEWNVRGRVGAWDTANRGIKSFIKNHTIYNQSRMKENMTTTLGWFSFFPDENPTAKLKNTIEKSLFRDDMDYLGMNALLYDMSIVFNPFNVNSISSNPFHKENILYYTNLYTKLRKSNYFTDETLNKVKEAGGEWKVIEKSQGEYAFLQMYYDSKRLGNLKGEKNYSFSAFNPYNSQKPFIRIESRYSTLFENPILLCEFNEDEAIGKNTVTKTFDSVDLTENMAISLRVKGTGGRNDALLVSLSGDLTSDGSNGHADYLIDLSFTGWRDVILVDADNGEYDFDRYSFSGIVVDSINTTQNYDTYRNVANFKGIRSVTLRTSGATAGTVQIGNVSAYTHTDSPVKNPTVKIGEKEIVFNCEMKGGEYLEYDPITNKAILYHTVEQTTEDVSFNEVPTAPKGNVTVTYSAQALTSATIRAKIKSDAKRS